MMGEDIASTAVTVALSWPEESDLWVRRDHNIPVVPKLKPQEMPELRNFVLPESNSSLAGGSGSALAVNKYLITGGTGGLGFALLDWLVSTGEIAPDQIILLSRRQVKPPIQGLRVVVVDITSLDSLIACKELKELGKVTGVFHLAGVLEDTMVYSMQEAKLRKVLGPKSTAAVNLLEVSKILSWNIGWFVAFSSTSSLLGFPGQSNYCAANHLLDNMATFGLDELSGSDSQVQFVSINWGPWGEAGMAKAGSKAHAVALKDGDRPLTTKMAVHCLKAILQIVQENPSSTSFQFAVCDVDWARSAHWSTSPYVELLSVRNSPQINSKRSTKSDQGVEPLEAFFQEYMDKNWHSLEKSTMAAAGLDSLDVVTMRNSFAKKFKAVPLSIFTKPNATFGQLKIALRSCI